MHIRFKLVAWILIATYAMIPIGGHAFASKVLCVETEGHVVVDGSAGVRCAAGSEINSPASPVMYMGDHHLLTESGHCSDCVDIMISPANDQDCVALVSEQDTASWIQGLVTPCSDVPPATSDSSVPGSAWRDVVQDQLPNHLFFLSSVVLIV